MTPAVSGAKAAPVAAAAPPSAISGSTSDQKQAGTRQLDAVGPALLEWDGQLFYSAGAFRTYLLRKGIGWSNFVESHPRVVSALGLPSVIWEGRQFFTQASLMRWLAATGVNYRSWAKEHPSAEAILAGRNGAGAAQTIRTPALLAAHPIVTWGGIGFTAPDVLRHHLATSKIDWNTFLVAHPTIVRRFELGSVRWDGKPFYTKQALTTWLAKRGIEYTAWARDHQAAASLITVVRAPR